MISLLLLRKLSHARASARNANLELEEARRQEALGTLAGGIAHDFNNILGSIMGFSALLEDDLISQPELREMAQQIGIAAKRGQGIVSQLMSYSKKNIREDKKMQAPVSLDVIIRENIALLKPSIRSSSQIIYKDKSKTDAVIANATQIGQALLNLCINADHAIGAKTGTIEITLDNEMVAFPSGNGGLHVSLGKNADDPVTLINGRLEAGNYVCISVKDNGEGMTPEIAKRIFDPFFTTKDVNVGTGLGLPAIQGIVHSHGGAIVVTTMRFKGTTFRLLFPVSKGEAARATAKAGKAFQL